MLMLQRHLHIVGDDPNLNFSMFLVMLLAGLVSWSVMFSILKEESRGQTVSRLELLPSLRLAVPAVSAGDGELDSATQHMTGYITLDVST